MAVRKKCDEKGGAAVHLWTAPLKPKPVFSLMTSFTKCLQTSFTLPRERSERGSIPIDAMEDDGCPRTASELCGNRESGREVIDGIVPGVWHLAPHGIFMAVTLSAPGPGRDCRTQPAANEESGSNCGGSGRSGADAAAEVSRLGSAQAEGAVAAAGRGVGAEHDSSHSAAAWLDPRAGASGSGAATI